MCNAGLEEIVSNSMPTMVKLVARVIVSRGYEGTQLGKLVREFGLILLKPLDVGNDLRFGLKQDCFVGS